MLHDVNTQSGLLQICECQTVNIRTHPVNAIRAAGGLWEGGGGKKR